MAFNNKNLSVLAYANGFTLWHYTTVDADLTAENYFNSAAEVIRVGDMIIGNSGIGTSPKSSFYNVSGNSSGVVAVADLLVAAE